MSGPPPVITQDITKTTDIHPVPGYTEGVEKMYTHFDRRKSALHMFYFNIGETGLSGSP